MTSAPAALRNRLSLGAVTALVVGDMLGSGIFFAPGELAGVAERDWQVYLIWALAGLITLCGALTLGELCSLLPRAGASYHFICAAFGNFWGFLLVWMSLWVSGPGSVAGVGALMGEYLRAALPTLPMFTPVAFGAAAIAFFILVNLAGVEWGGRTQVTLTIIKIVGIAALVVGGLWLMAPGAESSAAGSLPSIDESRGVRGFIRVVGLGIAAVLFTYDGWIDVSHVAGEVRNPERDLPKALGFGVGVLTLLYLVVNFVYLRAVPIEVMQQAPGAMAAAAPSIATKAYGPQGGLLLNALVAISMFGAMGGLVMTLPRLYYTMAAEYGGAGGMPIMFFRTLSRVSPSSGVPVVAVVFTGIASITALVFFGSFSRLANYLVVPMQLGNVLMVASLFRLRRQIKKAIPYRTPGYPVTPLVYIVVMLGFLVSAVVYRPMETLIGLALSATGIPVYFWLRRNRE